MHTKQEKTHDRHGLGKILFRQKNAVEYSKSLHAIINVKTINIIHSFIKLATT